jgi:predicted phosphodiesterase
MRIAILADVHANLAALQAVLDDAARRGADHVVVAGDLVGYGPDPDRCVALLAEREAVCVAGNHDLWVTGRLPAARFSELARRSLEVTEPLLGSDTLAYLAALPVGRTVFGLSVAHGSPEDPEEYVTRPSRARQLLDELSNATPQAAALVLGHTHRQWRFHHAALREDGEAPLQLLNPGSVGQSRQREAQPRARYAMLTTATSDAQVSDAQLLSVPYHSRPVVDRLDRLGLPPACIHNPPARSRTLRAAAYRAARAAGLVG